jgi:hypothetical protein
MNFSRWMGRLWETQDDEISCTECLDLIPQYVELELTTGAAEIRMPELKQHLDQCKACLDDAVFLLDVARREEEGTLPPVEDLKDSLQ